MFENLTDKNVLLYAAKQYETPNCILSEFEEDYKHIKYIKKLFQKYREGGILKERLILNHIICLGNLFGVNPTKRLLFFKLPEQYYSVLKTFLLYLQYMPDIVEGVNGINIISDEIPVDLFVAKILRGI